MEPRQHPRITHDDVMTAAEVADMLNVYARPSTASPTPANSPPSASAPPSAFCARASRRCWKQGESAHHQPSRRPAGNTSAARATQKTSRIVTIGAGLGGEGGACGSAEFSAVVPQARSRVSTPPEAPAST